jgi:hypothetical protein
MEMTNARRRRACAIVIRKHGPPHGKTIEITWGILMKQLGVLMFCIVIAGCAGTHDASFKPSLAAAPDTTKGITVENRSSILMQADDPLTAAIAQTSLGRELVVAGTVSSRTAAGERLIEAILKIVITQVDGTLVQSGNDIAHVTPDERLQWKVLLKPSGILDEALIAKIVVQDLSLSTVERSEREMRESAGMERQANMKRAEAERQTAAKRESTIKARMWPQEIERAVIERKVTPGMTTDQVSMAWGPPSKVNETLRASGVSQQWVYPMSGNVFFEDGRVTAIETSR